MLLPEDARRWIFYIRITPTALFCYLIYYVGTPSIRRLLIERTKLLYKGSYEYIRMFRQSFWVYILLFLFATAGTVHGNIKINTLPNINTNYNNNRKHTISGAVIITNPLRLNCTDCAPGEKRVFVGYVDHLINRAGYMMLKKTTFSGQEAIKIFIGYNGVRKRDGDVIPEVTIPYGWYTLIKQ